ncbi:hypothetical protein BGZ94_000827 [Podila epigama]|nr:hypothetical protein BGZ94_000827 [Podila epigama]
MNMLVDYASESSDSETEIAATHSKPADVSSESGRESVHDNTAPLTEASMETATDVNPEEENYISAAMKELQSLAASVDDTSNIPKESNGDREITPDLESPDLAPEKAAEEDSSSDEDDNDKDDIDKEEENDKKTAQFTPAPPSLTPEQTLIFQQFMERIDAIPLTSVDQSEPPPYPKKLVPAPPLDPMQIELDWQRSQSVQSVYSRIHCLSLLESPAVDNEDIESRLIEFAIRILDWEQGGLNSVYFLGPERAYFESQSDKASDHDRRTRLSSEEPKESLPPPFGGVVGETLQNLYELEAIAAPPRWSLKWNPQEESYGFHHISTGTLSEKYPSEEERKRLDPDLIPTLDTKKRRSLSTTPEPVASIDITKKQKMSADTHAE